MHVSPGFEIFPKLADDRDTQVQSGETNLADRRAILAVLACFFLGTTLRLMAARGALWFDEVWSLKIVGIASSPDQVFWALPHANNHPLNSLWLYILGPDQAPMLYRLPAVLCGAMSILAAAQVGWRFGRTAAVWVALLVSLSYPLVNYGSEARGYAGLILCLLLGTYLLDKILEERDIERTSEVSIEQWQMGAVVGFGTLWHFTMLSGLMAFGLAALFRLRQDGRGWRDSVVSAVGLFVPTLIILIPIALVTGFGIIRNGGMALGTATPFTWERFATGFGGLLALLLGFPSWAPPALAGLALLAGIAATIAARRLPVCLLPLTLSACLVPAGMAVMRLPNLEVPRFFLPSGIILMLVLAIGGARCWHRGGRISRIATGSVLVLVLVGHMALDWRLLVQQRGYYRAAAQQLTTQAETTYTSNSALRAQMMVDFEARSAPTQPTFVLLSDPAAFCRSAPSWYISDAGPDEQLPQRTVVGPDRCRMAYVLTDRYPSSFLSGRQWGLFRKAG